MNNMTNPIRVLMVDDHVLFRAGIRSLLEPLAGIDVVGDAGSGLEALRLIEVVQADVLIMDIIMPELNGLETTARIREHFPNVRVIILSMNAAEEYVLQALRVGAAGYLLKNVSPVELEQAVRAVARGETFMASSISKHVVAAYSKRVNGKSSSLERLTARQREVLQLLAEGHRSKEIAAKLDLRIKTVEMHRAQLMMALDIHNIAGLVRYALRVGVISTDS